MNKELDAVIPLESDPEVFNTFAHNLGLKREYSFVDIYSIDDPALLEFLVRPVMAIILLFPPVETKEAVQTNNKDIDTSTDKPIWLRQNFKNACGLYALLHILANNKQLLADDSSLLKFINDIPNFTDTDLSKFIIEFINHFNADFVHNSGSSVNPNPDDIIDLHFITFISYGDENKLYELDGRSAEGKPIYIGQGHGKDLIEEELIVNRIRGYMNSVKDENDKLKFSLIGLSVS
ncbi:hypothetical protein KAFR_0G00890 [Kazachstania africana CBS 2517]|uniref:Ubiquitin carboxyl-terminal hydrolase n=1 Tax=Kazachstania africana (strain ATCC 22294 / BCRC 22015 / CBS 2517 / CECT 1963 / NBRC 1671 / NRRL Y-8276) TaxID=1071382 RepID=H2AXM2_KAZAF|nr:hypothetical protein KAFR_0G00890 [Kazachstania africana CBS 2517]CCF59122.1 hypothetical protein KAFR_0G00890 [Kazachstania africana CBS 2517]